MAPERLWPFQLYLQSPCGEVAASVPCCIRWSNSISGSPPRRPPWVRDGQERELAIAELVPGDIIRLDAGDLVPAGARLLEVKDLRVRESALTGESLSVAKSALDLREGSTVLPTHPQCIPGHRGSDRPGTAVIVRTG